MRLAGVPVQLVDLPAQPAGHRPGVHLGLDHHPAADDVQPAGEPQQRGDLGAPAARLGDDQPAQLVLDRGGHRHRGPPGDRFGGRTSCESTVTSSLPTRCPTRPTRPARRSGRSCRPASTAADRLGQRRRVVPGHRVVGGDRGQLHPPARGQHAPRPRGAAGPAPAPRRRRRAPRPPAAPGRAAESTSRCCSGENPAVSPGSGARLSTTTRRARLSMIASRSSGTSRCGSTLVNHEPGPRNSTSAARTAATRLRAGPRRVRPQPHPPHLARGRRHRDLAADPVRPGRVPHPGR